MNIPDSPIDVTILTGFLGSGKTTVLKHWLQSDLDGEYAVIINEFGKEGLDHLIIEEQDNEVVVLESGCVCCTIREDLRESIICLLRKRMKGEVPPFKRLFIETSGLSNPAPILQLLIKDQVISHHFRLHGLISVLDALCGINNLDNNDESKLQLMYSDYVLISKSDLASEEELGAIYEKVKEIKPDIKIGITTENLESILDYRWSENCNDIPKKFVYFQDKGHKEKYVSYSYSKKEHVTPLEINNWINELVNKFGDRLLRVKCVLNVAGEKRKVFIHAVQHFVHPPSYGGDWGDVAQSKIVLIGKNIEHDELELVFKGLGG